MRIDKQPVACCYLGELRQRQAFLLHDLCTQEPIVSRARGADRIDLNRIERWHSRRPQGHSNNSASLPSTNARHPSTLDQDRSRMHSMPSPRSRVLHQATPMVTIPWLQSIYPPLQLCISVSLPQKAGSVCVWNCDTSGKKHRVWPSTIACANSSFPRVEDRSGRFSGSGRR